MSEPRPLRVYVILALGLVSVMMSPIFIRFASDAPSIAVGVWRTVFAAILLTPVAVPRIGSEVRQFSRRDWMLVVGAGVLLGLHIVAWIESIYHTTVASASVLVWTNPLFMAVLGAMLLGWGDLADANNPAPNPLMGNSLALAAAVLVSI